MTTSVAGSNDSRAIFPSSSLFSVLALFNILPSVIASFGTIPEPQFINYQNFATHHGIPSPSIGPQFASNHGTSPPFHSFGGLSTPTHGGQFPPSPIAHQPDYQPFGVPHGLPHPQSLTPPPFPKDLPPGFADVLPTETVAKLRAIHQNDNLTWQQKHQQIDAIMNSLPPEILDRLPAPPGFSMLPAEIQAKFKAIQQHSGLNWQQRHAKILEIMQSMTPDQRMLLPPAPPSSPPMFHFPPRL